MCPKLRGDSRKFEGVFTPSPGGAWAWCEYPLSHTHPPFLLPTLARVEMVFALSGSRECLCVEGHRASTLPRSHFHLIGPECPEMGRLVRDARRNPKVCLWAPAVSQTGKVCCGQADLGVGTGKYPGPGVLRLGPYPGSVTDLLGILEQSSS